MANPGAAWEPDIGTWAGTHDSAQPTSMRNPRITDTGDADIKLSITS